MNELVRDLAPRYVPTKFDRNRRRTAPGKALTGLCLQTDNLIPVYPPFNFVERGIIRQLTGPIYADTWMHFRPVLHIFIVTIKFQTEYVLSLCPQNMPFLSDMSGMFKKCQAHFLNFM